MQNNHKPKQASFLLSQSDNYCYQNLLRDITILISDHQSSKLIVCKNIIEIISFIRISFGGVIKI